MIAALLSHRFTAAVLVGLAISTACAAVAAAHGRAFPYHKSGGAYCYLDGSSATIKVFPPVEMYSYGPNEKIQWSTNLFRLTRRVWRPYITTMPWLINVTTRAAHMDHGGTVYWMRTNAQPTTFWPFYDLPRGTYRIREYFKWSNGAVHKQWMQFSRNTPPSGRCAIP
jgi:hypothetical protein